MKSYDLSRFDHLINTAVGNGDGHYRGTIQPQHFSASNRMLFNLSNIIKYVERFPFKGKPLSDLKKARWYTEYQIIDDEYYASPAKSDICITPEEYVKAHPDFDAMQIRIPYLIYEYNWEGGVENLRKVKDLLDLAIDSWEG